MTPTIIADGQSPSMIDITLDFETYYDSECSLSILSALEYVHHPDFEVIGCAVGINGAKARWVAGEKECREVFAKIPWDRVRMSAHNAQFDATVLKERFGHTPREYYCTMMASRPHIVPFSQSMSLDAVSKHLGIQAKGDFAATKAKGKHLKDFTPAEIRAYGEYACIDADNCTAIYKHTAATLSEDERRMIHLTVSKALHPQFHLDVLLLQNALAEEKERKACVLQKARIDKDDIMSNKKFAAALQVLGVSSPMKVSPTTGKQTMAFAKTDTEFLALLEHPNDDVRLLVEARLGAKSTIEESRLERFIAIALVSAWMPFPLLYYAAHTGRMGGYDKMNMQNLTRGSALRRAIIAPQGYKVVASDASQIEARMVAWLAGQDDMLAAFHNNEDVYCQFGTRVFGKVVTKADKGERFISKVGVLSLMYASGADKFRHTVNISGQVPAISASTAQMVVDGYRSLYPNIKRLWNILSRMILAMIRGDTVTYKCLTFTRVNGVAQIHMPGGRVMYYPELYIDGNKETWYKGNKGEWKKIYGGALLENISQALSQIVIRDVELRVAKESKYRITAAGQVHDELLYCVPDRVSEKFAGYLTAQMSKPPEWAPDFPLACETHIGVNYAEAK